MRRAMIGFGTWAASMDVQVGVSNLASERPKRLYLPQFACGCCQIPTEKCNWQRYGGDRRWNRQRSHVLSFRDIHTQTRAPDLRQIPTGRPVNPLQALGIAMHKARDLEGRIQDGALKLQPVQKTIKIDRMGCHAL